jgi:hypothetical protein
MTDNTETIVIFRKWRNGDVIALFPCDAASVDNPALCNSYEYVGQHGAADCNGVIRRTASAEPSEYVDLFLELTSIGYKLKVYKREQYFMLQQREAMMKAPVLENSL